MGLAASQGRLLALTARNNDLIYEAQQISQQRVFLAKATQAAAEKYNEAMNNTIMQATINGQTQQLSYDLITSTDPFAGLSMRLVDLNGNVVVPGDFIEVQKLSTDEGSGENYKRTVGKFKSAQDFVNAYMSDLPDDEKFQLSNSSLSSVFTYYNDTYTNKEENTSVYLRNKDTSYLVKEGEKTVIDENVYDLKYLQQMLVSGEFKLQQAQPGGTYEDLVWQGSTMISEVFDTSDDAQAEAEYEEAMKKFQADDKLLEMRLNQVETQQKAVSQERESVRKIIDENVEESFKTFA